jgi:type I restriction-modification system DNA methylase subunit
MGNSENEKCDIETLKLIANCQTKLKNYKKAHLYFNKALDYCRKTKGEKCKEFAKLKIDEAKTYNEEKNYASAIDELNIAIGTSILNPETLIGLNYSNRMELVDLEELLSQYYEKNGETEKQIDTLFAKL